MFSFLKKKKKVVALYAACDGVLKSIEKVKDPVFADKIMGDGFAITPHSGNINVFSPIKGKVISIFPTKHAITFLSEDGIELLIHMGIDTVALNGEGFKVHINEGDTVDQNTKIADMDVDFIKGEGKDTDIIIIFTNLEAAQKIHLTDFGEVKHSTPIGEIDCF